MTVNITSFSKCEQLVKAKEKSYASDLRGIRTAALKMKNLLVLVFAIKSQPYVIHNPQSCTR